MPPDPRPGIVSQIYEFLSKEPLYKTFKYEGNLWSSAQLGPYFSFPDTIGLYCDAGACKTVQLWGLKSGSYFRTGSTTVNTFESADFECRNCRESRVIYFLHFDLSRDRGEITKVGQWPPLSRDPDPTVVSGWNKADRLLYRDAMTFRNGNKGIAALPYLRRIIENHIRDVLELVADANKRRPIPGFDAARFEQVRNSRAFSDKLDFVRDHLPQDLTPAGLPNPVATLYDLISGGLHEETEDECVAIFDRCKTAFEYVVKKLTDAKREDEEYIQAIRGLKKQ